MTTKRIPGIGEAAPDFTVSDSEGNQFNLKDTLQTTGFFMLVFYRGHW